VCAGEVCMLRLARHPRPTLFTGGLLWASLSSLSPPSAQGQSPWVVYGLSSAAFSVFCPIFLHFLFFTKYIKFLSSLCYIPQLALCSGSVFQIEH